MSLDYLQSIYAQMGKKLDPDESYFSSDSRFLTLEQLLRSLPKGKLLDIGCGRGLLLRRLADHHESHGCDFDPGAVAACEEAGLNVCQVDLNTAATLSRIDGETFDVIVISEVCEHLLNPRSALQLVKRHLSENGTLIVTVPNALPLFARLPLLFGRRLAWLHYPSMETEVTGHIRFYTITSMSELLQEEGFSVEFVRGVSFRMNGYFWERVCYRLSRLMGKRDSPGPAEIDGWLGKQFPDLAPGLLFFCKLKNSKDTTLVDFAGSSYLH